MKIVCEKVEPDFYAEIILTPQDIQKMENHEIIEELLLFQYRKLFISVRLRGLWDEPDADYIEIPSFTDD